MPECSSCRVQRVALGDLVSEALAGADPVARARQVRVGGRVEQGLDLVARPDASCPG